MKNTIKIKSSFLLAILTILTSYTSLASVTSVTNTVNNRNIAIGQTAYRTITWNVTVIAPPGSITSPTVTFNTNTNFTLGTISKPLTRAIPAGTSATYSLVEQIQIPSSFIYRARKMGATQISITRDFNDGSTSGAFSSTAIFTITGSSATGFSVNQVSVRFDNNQPQLVVKRLKRVSAYINISYNGSGLLQGVWEIATPTTTIGQPVYSPLRVVRRQLTGTGIAKIFSPRLPTLLQGIYLVRFRITDPASNMESPLIRYFVYTGQKPLLSPVHVFLHQPGPDTTVGEKTLFSWSKIDKASALRFELYAIKQQNTLGNKLPELGTDDKNNLEGGKFVAGILLRGSDTKTVLSRLTASRLKPAHWYLWRVVAFDKQGNIIGVSEPRKIQTPAK